MKIIHTADIHLDSPFTSMNPIEAEKRRNALRSAFSSLILYARTENVDVVLISGDLFDNDCITKDTAKAICKEMASVPDCRFFITPGNHDPYQENSVYKLIKFPENVHIFTDAELSFVELEKFGARIYGSAYTSDTKEAFTDASLPILDGKKTNILMHHGDLDVSASVYNPVSSRLLEKSGFDYVALGHIHKGSEIGIVGATKFAYCGCIEGRDFGECGYKGAITGEIEKGSISLHHVRFCSKRYEVISIDVSGKEDTDSCLAEIVEKCSSFGEDTLLRIELYGIVSEAFSINEEAIREAVSRPCYLEIKDSTNALLNIEKLKTDKSLAGEFYRALEEKLYSSDEQERHTASLALKYGLRAIYGLEIKP